MDAVKKRVEKWDNLKLLLIFLVVLGHICDFYTGSSREMNALFFTIYTFHMPLFIFISGLFSKKNVEQKRYDKIFSYLILYVVLKIILFLPRLITGESQSISWFFEGGLPWYALAMFAFSMITIGLKKVSPVYVFVAAIIFACFCGYDRDVSKFLAISRIVVYFPFFYAGYCLDADRVIKILSNKYIKIASVAVLIIFLSIVFIKTESVYWLRPLLTGQNPYFVLKDNLAFGACYRVLYYIIVFIICAAIISLTPSKIGRGYFAKLGSRSLQVYSLHYFFIIFLYELPNSDRWMKMIFPSHPVWLIIPTSVLIVLICSSKYLTPVFDFILHPKKKQ